MATFTITAPDGKRYKVTGATKEGALAALKSKLEGPQQPTQPQQQPQVQEANPAGTGVSRAIQRGALQTAAAVPTMAATADIRALSDQDRLASAEEKRGIIYDELKRAGVPAQAFASRGVNLDDPQNVVALMQQYSVPPAAQANFSQVVEKRLDNASQVDTAAATQRAQSNLEAAGALQDKAAALPKSSTASRYEQSLAEAPDSFKGWLGSITNDPIGFMAWAGETLSESGPSIAGGLATTAVAGPVAGSSVLALGGLSREYSNEVNRFLEEKGVDLSDPNSAKVLLNNPQAMDEANQRGLTRGLVIAMFELAGQGAVASSLFGKTLARRTVSQATTEGGGEAAATASVGDDVSIKEALAEGVVGAGATIPEAAIAGRNKLFTSDGKLDVNNLDNSTKLAAGDVARELQQIATAEGFKLSNVDVTAQFGAKGALEAVREQNNGEITELVKALKGKLNSKNASSLDQVISDFAPANAGIKSGKNKVSGYVSKTQMAALARLVGPYQEGAALMNALAKSNVITGLFKGGMKGGVSQFTDYFSPFGTSGAVYDPTRIGNIIVGGGAAAATLGQSVPIQAGIVGLGRLVDAATGRRNKLSRFVNKNVNAQGLPSPSGVSLVDKAKAAESDAKVRREALARIATQIDAPPNANSPVGTILSGTGLSRDGLSQTINSMAQDFAGQPELAPVLESIQQNMDGDTNPVLELNEIIPIIGQYAQMTAPELIVATPDNPLLARGVQQSPTQTDVQTEAPSQPRSESSINADFDALAIEKKQLEAQASSIQDEISNLSLEEAQARKQEFAARMAPIQQRLADISSQMDSLGSENQARRSGNQFTTPENYQAGKSDNNSFARSLAAQVSEDAGVSVSDKAQLMTALEDVQSSLGPDPVAALDEITTELQNIGVNRDVIDTYFKPYRDRVALQQARVGRMQAPETEDRPRFQMAIPLFEEPLAIEGKPTVKKIGEAMNQDHLDKVGRQLTPESSPEDYSTVYGYADQELSKQLEQPNSGVGWYSKDVDDSMRLASKVFPTLANNPEHRQLYLTFAGIFSNGADPDNAFMMSAGAFDDFLRTGQIPVNRAQGFYEQGLEPPKTTFKSTKTGKMVTKDAGWGIRNQANEQQLGMLKYLVEREGGLKPAMEFLLTPQKRSDINEVMLDSGLYKAGRFTTKAEKAGADEYGFLAFGKKLGRYSLGLHGVDIDAGDTTIDLWYTRTFRRWTGRLLETPIGKEGVAAQPANDAERDAIFKLTGELAEKYNLPVGDVQALLWFFEKRTWGAQGLNTKEGTNSSGARKLLKERGIDPDQDDDRAGSDAAGVQPSQTSEQPRFNQQPTGVAGILAQRIQGSQDGSTARRPVPTTQEVKLEAPTVRAAIEIGKPGGEFENGIPQGLESAKRFAKAVDITLQLVEDNEAMLDAARITGEDRDAGKNASGVYNKYGAFVMKPGSKLPSSDRFISDFEAYVTAFHETMHGLSGTDLEGKDVPEALISKNYLTGEVDYAAPRTFDGLIGQLVNTPSVNSNNVIKDILKIQDEEVFTNGDNVQPVRISGPAKRILGVIPDMTERAEVQAEIDRFEKYSRSVSELAVDALTFYGTDPKRMKKEYPHAAKAVREFFKNSTKVQFYSHPLAMAFAVVMAMLMKQEQAEEEQERQKQQQMAPGALTPPPGALSAA